MQRKKKSHVPYGPPYFTGSTFRVWNRESLVHSCEFSRGTYKQKDVHTCDIRTSRVWLKVIKFNILSYNQYQHSKKGQSNALNLGRIRISNKGGSILDRRRLFSVGGSGGMLPRKILKFKSSEMRFPTFWGQVMVSVEVLFFQAKMSLFCIKILQNYAKIIKIMYSYSNLHLQNYV